MESVANSIDFLSLYFLRNLLMNNFLFSEPDERKCYEQHENPDSPLRCPIKLYEFYLSKW